MARNYMMRRQSAFSLERPRRLQGSAMTVHADFTRQEYFRNPTAEIEKLRAAGPVVEVRFPLVGTVWTTTTQDLANQVLRDSQTFTLRRDDGNVVGLQWWMPKIVRAIANNMLSADEPDHIRLRGVVDEAFRRQAVLEMEPRILAIAGELANELFADGSPVDLVDRYARRLPLSVICELLGLPLADRPKFTAWASGLTRFTGPLSLLSVVPKIFAMKRYMEERLEATRETGGDGLIAELVRVEREGRRISRDEMVAMLFLLLFAGHETTTHLISGSVCELLRNPGLRDWLEEDWSRAELAVEEFLRFVSPVQFTKPRFVEGRVWPPRADCGSSKASWGRRRSAKTGHSATAGRCVAPLGARLRVSKLENPQRSWWRTSSDV
jgi:cytochrome P450